MLQVSGESLKVKLIANLQKQKAGPYWSCLFYWFFRISVILLRSCRMTHEELSRVSPLWRFNPAVCTTRTSFGIPRLQPGEECGITRGRSCYCRGASGSCRRGLHYHLDTQNPSPYTLTRKGKFLSPGKGVTSWKKPYCLK